MLHFYDIMHMKNKPAVDFTHKSLNEFGRQPERYKLKDKLKLVLDIMASKY
jgi:hypothetical protein